MSEGLILPEQRTVQYSGFAKDVLALIETLVEKNLAEQEEFVGLKLLPALQRSADIVEKHQEELPELVDDYFSLVETWNGGMNRIDEVFGSPIETDGREPSSLTIATYAY